MYCSTDEGSNPQHCNNLYNNKVHNTQPFMVLGHCSVWSCLHEYVHSTVTCFAGARGSARQSLVLFCRCARVCSTVTCFVLQVRTGLPHSHSYNLEDLFYKQGVDLQFYAHEHSYERLWPVYNLTVRPQHSYEKLWPIMILYATSLFKYFVFRFVMARPRRTKIRLRQCTSSPVLR